MLRPAAGGDVEQNHLLGPSGPLDAEEHEVPIVRQLVDEAWQLRPEAVELRGFLVGHDERLARGGVDGRAHARCASRSDARHHALVRPRDRERLEAGVPGARGQGDDLAGAQVLGLVPEGDLGDRAVPEAHGHHARASRDGRQLHGGDLAPVVQVHEPAEASGGAPGCAEYAADALDEVLPRRDEERVAPRCGLVGARQGDIVAALGQYDLKHELCGSVVVQGLDVQVRAQPLPAKQLLLCPNLVLKIRVRSLEIVPPRPPPTHGIAAALDAIEDELMDHIWNRRPATSVELPLHLLGRGQLLEGAQGPLLLRVEGAEAGLLAAVLALDVALEAGTRVAKLKHEALRELSEVDGVRVRYVMERGVQQLLGRNRDRHFAIHQALRVHDGPRDREDVDVVTLVVKRLLEKQDQHQGQRMVRRACDHGVAEDRIRFVLGVWLVRDDPTCFLPELDDWVQAFHVDGDHVRVNIQPTIVPKELEAQDVRFALPHLFLSVDLLIEHRQLGDAVVGPKLETPRRVRCEVIDAEGVDPQARRLARADPDLVDDLGDLGHAAQVLHVLRAAGLPLGRVPHGALAAVPVVKGPDGLDH
mmetsp:Transcript_96548/g.295343  ORF Transcript_96548/g.295343 Transcript_96548/m.295343 type:complete len:588 (+) Transcript_96548:549-2312(+)